MLRFAHGKKRSRSPDRIKRGSDALIRAPAGIGRPLFNGIFLPSLPYWGRTSFVAHDKNGDGTLDVAVLPKPGAPDQNPILNAIWLFPADASPSLEQVIAGKLNAVALRYIAVGGSNDQSL